MAIWSPSYRFKDTAKKLEEITPVPILRSEPGAKSTEGIRFMHILCDNHFSISVAVMVIIVCFRIYHRHCQQYHIK